MTTRPKTLPIRIFALGLALGLAGCAQMGADADRFETTNRKIHAFNKTVDTAIFGSVEEISPVTEQAAITLSNVSGNLGLPAKVVNSLLQARPEPAIKNTFRFAINSTIGLGGLFDPATSSFSLAEEDTDFGETLHVWGAGEGDYLELPILGPSTSRDTLGIVVDTAMDPVGQFANATIGQVKTGAGIGSKVGDRLRFDESFDSIFYESADSYAQLRLLYLQNRRHSLGTTAESPEYDPYDDPYAN